MLGRYRVETLRESHADHRPNSSMRSVEKPTELSSKTRISTSTTNELPIQDSEDSHLKSINIPAELH